MRINWNYFYSERGKKLGTNGYYSQRIKSYEMEIENNKKKIERLEEIKTLFERQKKTAEEYLEERDLAYKVLQNAQSKGVILLGERLKGELTYSRQLEFINSFEAIEKKITGKIEELYYENVDFQRRADYLREEDEKNLSKD